MSCMIEDSLFFDQVELYVLIVSCLMSTVFPFQPLDVNVMSDNTNIDPRGHERYVGGFRVLQLQKLWVRKLS